MKRIVMDKIRKGNDISVEWAIFIDSEGQQAPYDLTGRKLTMYLTNRYGTSQVSDFKTEGNILRWTFYGKDQKHLGNYTLTLVENEGKNYMHTVDVCNAFCLVNHSCETLASDEDQVKLVYLGFSSEISTGYGSIQIDDALSEESENPVQNKVITEALKEKVDKVEGKQLSTEDFTTALKTKLEGLSNYDDTQIAKRIQEVEADIPTKVSQLENDRGYLTEHQDISNLASKNDLAKKQDVISDLATIRSGASKGATALQSIPSEYVTENELNAKGYATTSQVNAKQDTISDLATIRSGAALGSTAIQSVKTINGQSIEGEGNITIEGGGSIDPEILEGYMPLMREFSDDFNNDFTR